MRSRSRFVPRSSGARRVALAANADPSRSTLERRSAAPSPPTSSPMVGNWIVAQDGRQNVLMVDGRQWKKGEPSGGLADKARAIYGSATRSSSTT